MGSVSKYSKYISNIESAVSASSKITRRRNFRIKSSWTSFHGELYLDLCLNIRNIYQKCKLVHGDLSEFNLLYHDGKAYIIDVSQSVEHDHPHALEFLRKDIHNVTEFFR